MKEMGRICIQCGKEKKPKEFYARQSRCKACTSENKKVKRQDPEKGEKIRERDKAAKKRVNATEEGAKKNRDNVKRWRRNTGKH